MNFAMEQKLGTCSAVDAEEFNGEGAAAKDEEGDDDVEGRIGGLCA